jgi:hypothetical protein
MMHEPAEPHFPVAGQALFFIVKRVIDLDDDLK